MIRFLSEKFMKTGSTAITKGKVVVQEQAHMLAARLTEDIFGKPPKIHQTIQQVMWPSTENCVASYE
jgi:hypothetical protein